MNMLEKLKKLDGKQKVKLIALIVVLLIVVWQLSSLFGSSGSRTPAIKKQSMIAPQVSERPGVIKKESLPKLSAEATNNTSKSQRNYIDALNKLQMLQVEQKILTTKESISQAKLSIATTEKNLMELNAPPPIPAPIPVATYAKHLVNPAGNQPSFHIIDNSNNRYKLLYVANVSGAWQAIIGNQGKLYNVTIGTALPNGSRIATITDTTVTLENGNTRKTISITPVI
jgi:hypothetical protein